jgi:hypothetical protein
MMKGSKAHSTFGPICLLLLGLTCIANLGSSNLANAARRDCGKEERGCTANCDAAYRTAAGIKICYNRCADLWESCVKAGGRPTAIGPGGGNPPKHGPIYHPPISGGTHKPPSEGTGGKTLGVKPPASSGTQHY